MRYFLLTTLTAIVALIFINSIDYLIVNRINTFNNNSLICKDLEGIKQANDEWDLNRQDRLI